MKKVYLTLLGCYLALCGYSQAVVMTPNNSGGFENGATFAANTWTEVNGPFNRWAVGNGSVAVGTRGAYIGNTTTYTGTNNAATNHFYRNTFNLPAGATNALLTFRYLQPITDFGNDSLIVSIGVSTLPVPTVGTTVAPGYTRLYQNTATAFPGYVEIGPIDVSAFANNNLRLVFTHVNNGAGPNGIPAIDSVSLNYCPAITGTMVMCSGNSVNLACANTTGGAWSSSNTAIAAIGGSTTTTANVIGGATTGTATITHTGGTCTVTATVTVNPVPTAITGTLMACAGSTTVLSSTPAGGTWTSSNAAVATVTGGTVNALAAGTSNITYMFLPTCRAVATVTVNALPVAFGVTGGGSFCASGSGVPVGLGNSATGIDYTLYDGATVVTTVSGTGAAISFGTISVGGTYTATGTDATTGCVNDMTGSATVTVTSPVTPAVTIGSTASGTVCSGTAVTFTATPINEGTTPTYNWYVNGTPAATGISYSYMPSNGDIVRVTLHPGGICVDPDSATTTQTQIITPMAAPGLTIVVAPSNPSCLGSPVTFSTTPMLGGSTPGYRWTKNGINVATGPTYTYVPATGDMVYCVMTSNYQCRNVDTALSNLINMTTQASAPLATIDIMASPGTLVSPGTMVTLTAVRTGGGTSAVGYQWHINGTEVPGATNAVYSDDSYVNGDIVTCKVINTDPCANFSLTSIVINTTGTGVSTINTDRRFVVVPNPNNGTFSLLGKVNETVANIKVTNVTGQTVYNNTVQVTGQELNEKLNLGTLPAGLYIITVNTTSGANTLHFSVVK